jgi:hypothetical protein
MIYYYVCFIKTMDVPTEFSNSLRFETYLNLVNKMWLFEHNCCHITKKKYCCHIVLCFDLYNHGDDDTLHNQRLSHW